MKKFIVFISLLLLFFSSFAFAKRNDGWYGKGYAGLYGIGGKAGYRNRHIDITVLDYNWPYYGHNRRHGYYRNTNWAFDPYYRNYYYYYDSVYYREKNQAAFNEIEKLERKKAAAEKAKQELASIKIIRARFYKQFTTDTLPISMAEITIENRSKYSLTKLYLRGSLKTHITGKVLIDEPFEYDMAYTLEQGDRATYKIPLNAFGSWSKARPPDMAVFTVSVTGAATTSGEALIGSFSASEQKKLNELKRKYAY